MKIIVEKMTFIEEEIDIEFPIYRIHEFDDGAIYTKIVSQDVEINIHIWADQSKIEIEIDTPCIDGSDYSLGKSIWALTEDQFNNAYIKSKSFVDNINCTDIYSTIDKNADKWVFETNGHKWSNNDNTAGDNYISFVQGAKSMII